MNDKIRLRSDEELEMQRKGLVELADALDAEKIPHFLASGTLLGAVREKNFIRWDWDVQLYFRTEDVFERRDKIVDVMTSAGFDVTAFTPDHDNLKYVAYKYGTKYEITAWYRDGDMRLRKNSNLKASFFDGTDTVDFLGRVYPCMSPAVEYLEFCYGDWRTPRREDDKKKYLNPDFYRRKGMSKVLYSVGRFLRHRILSGRRDDAA